MPTTIDVELQQHFQQLNEEEKSGVLQLIKIFLKNRPASSERITIEEYNREIDAALEEAESGNYMSQEEMEKRAAKW